MLRWSLLFSVVLIEIYVEVLEDGWNDCSRCGSAVRLVWRRCCPAGGTYKGHGADKGLGRGGAAGWGANGSSPDATAASPRRPKAPSDGVAYGGPCARRRRARGSGGPPPAEKNIPSNSARFESAQTGLAVPGESLPHGRWAARARRAGWLCGTGSVQIPILRWHPPRTYLGLLVEREVHPRRRSRRRFRKVACHDGPKTKFIYLRNRPLP